MSNSYWSQVERGRSRTRAITPTRQMILAIAEALRLTRVQTDEILDALGERRSTPTDRQPDRFADVDLTGLSRGDVALLNAIAARFRTQVAATAATLTDVSTQQIVTGKRAARRGEDERR